jgi:hypothetical protein
LPYQLIRGYWPEFQAELASQEDNPFSSSVGELAGFSLHAGVATNANEREKLERLCRDITRPAVSTTC